MGMVNCGHPQMQLFYIIQIIYQLTMDLDDLIKVDGLV